MIYDFDKPVARRHSGCYKWDIDPREGIIPLWVADMVLRCHDKLVPPTPRLDD